VKTCLSWQAEFRKRQQKLPTNTLPTYLHHHPDLECPQLPELPASMLMATMMCLHLTGIAYGQASRFCYMDHSRNVLY